MIERRYGLNGLEVHTLEQLAQNMDLTRERVRQIQSGSQFKHAYGVAQRLQFAAIVALTIAQRNVKCTYL